jgi:hypothetical protein
MFNRGTRLQEQLHVPKGHFQVVGSDSVRIIWRWPEGDGKVAKDDIEQILHGTSAQIQEASFAVLTSKCR